MTESKQQEEEKMNTNKKTFAIDDMKVKLSTLWIIVLFNMIFADIVGYMNPGALEDIIAGNVGIKITQELLLVFSILLEIPIAMVFLSRVLKYRANRWGEYHRKYNNYCFCYRWWRYLSFLYFLRNDRSCMYVINYLVCVDVA